MPSRPSHSPRHESTVTPVPAGALLSRLEQQVFAPTRAAGFEELAVATVTDPPPPIEAKRSPDGKWWVASTFELDRDPKAAQVVKNQETVFAAGLEALRLTAQAVGTAVRGSAVVGGAAVGALGTATVGVAGAALGAGASVGLDPVILGGVEDPESGKIAWVPIAAWPEQPQ